MVLLMLGDFLPEIVEDFSPGGNVESGKSWGDSMKYHRVIYYNMADNNATQIIKKDQMIFWVPININALFFSLTYFASKKMVLVQYNVLISTLPSSMMIQNEIVTIF